MERRLKDFQMDQVIVTNEYYVNAFAKEVAYLKSFQADRLLAGFRENRGLLPKAEKYPGWESTEIKGHTLGHYLTASSHAYTNTKDKQILDTLLYMMDELHACQFESGYISAFPEKLFDHVENNQPAWVPWYTMHKMISGFISVYKSTYSQAARDIVTKLGDWVFNRTSTWSPEVHAKVLAVEYGGMNDCLYELYRLTGDEKHLSAAHMFDELTLFTPIHEGIDILRGKHANTTIPKFLGALNRYKVLGESEAFYLEACIQFWDMVVHHHSYITGGNSEWEHFGEPDILNGERSNFTCETCNSYNMLKLTRELFKITKNVKYADFYENNLINAILSSQNPETGMTMYFQPMATGYFKVYSSPFDHFWCCTGTGMENFTKLNDSIYFHSENSLYVNQYISSSLTWEDMQMEITQTTNIPETDTARFIIRIPDGGERKLAVHFRVPDWASGEIAVALNGMNILCSVQEHYVVLDRVWQNNEVVDIQIPMKVSYLGLQDCQSVVGFKYGPVVLSAALGQADMVQSLTGVMVSVPTKSMLIKDFITIKNGSAAHWLDHIEEHLVKKEDQLAFVLRNTDEDDHLVFTPHYKQHQERYGIYWNIVEPDSLQLQQHILQKKQSQRLMAATIDSLPVGNDQYELEHHIQGEHTGAGTWDGYNFRGAGEQGWFSYEMKTMPGVDHYLSVTYFIGDAGRLLDIEVDGELLINETIAAEGNKRFFDRAYSIPAERIKDKQSITITFRAKGRTIGIYDQLRTMKSFDPNADMKALGFNTGQLSANFEPDLTEYMLTVSEETSAVVLSIAPENKNALIYVNDILIEDALPREIVVEGPSTVLNIRVKAEDDAAQKEYEVVIRKDEHSS